MCFSVPPPPLLLSADGEDSTVSIQIKLENEGSDEELETDILYSPQLALKLALTEWLGEFGVPHQYNSKFKLHDDNSRCFSGYLPEIFKNHTEYCVLSGRQVPQSGAKGTGIDVSSMAAPSLCSSTTVTTVFQQPIMSPAIPPLCLDPISLPMAKRPEEVRFDTDAAFV